MKYIYFLILTLISYLASIGLNTVQVLLFWHLYLREKLLKHSPDKLKEGFNLDVIHSITGKHIVMAFLWTPFIAFGLHYIVRKMHSETFKEEHKGSPAKRINGDQNG